MLIQMTLPKYRFCPPGESSGCKWKQDDATETSTYSSDKCLREVFLEVLKPTFMSLSDSKLLERCVLGTRKIPMSVSTVWCEYSVLNISTMVLK